MPFDGDVRDYEPLQVKILRRARELLLTQGWCQGYMALDRDGGETAWYDPGAAAFCSLGAVALAREELAPGSMKHSAGMDPQYLASANDLRDVLVIDKFGGSGVACFNDSAPNREAVIDVFDRAIRTVQEREAAHAV